VDVVLAVDTSTSIGRVNAVRLLEFCQSLVVGLDSRSRFALVTFSDRPRLALNFTGDKMLGYHALDSLSSAYTAAPSTDTAGALRLLCQLLQNSPSAHQRLVGVVVVDGRSLSLSLSLSLSVCVCVCVLCAPSDFAGWTDSYKFSN